MNQVKREPKRLMRQIEKITANYLWKHPSLWGQAKEDIFAKALEAVWEAGARTPGSARRAIYAALAKARDESKHHRSSLEPFQVRNAEKKAREGKDEKGRIPDVARQAAYKEFLEDYALVSQRSSFRDFDRLCVREAIAALEPDDRKIALRFLKLCSIKAVAKSFGVAPRTFLRREWADFKERFIAAWKQVDEESVAQTVSSNPYVFAGRLTCVGHGE